MGKDIHRATNINSKPGVERPSFLSAVLMTARRAMLLAPLKTPAIMAMMTVRRECRIKKETILILVFP
jgi:Na+-transporting methylmalonyl-CoA/oxaloacetate decarboxylase beta subunit